MAQDRPNQPEFDDTLDRNRDENAIGKQPRQDEIGDIRDDEEFEDVDAVEEDADETMEDR
jgi:hypothetical protein